MTPRILDLAGPSNLAGISTPSWATARPSITAAVRATGTTSIAMTTVSLSAPEVCTITCHCTADPRDCDTEL